MFEQIKGIKSFNKQVTFEECVFDRNLITSSTSKSMALGTWGQSHTKYEENIIFIEGKRYKFTKCKFLNCTVSKNLLNLSESEIIDCEFNGCLGVDLPCSYLLELKNSSLINSRIHNCEIYTSKENRSETNGGIVFVKNGKIFNCNFKDCSSNGSSTYGPYASYKMQIVCGKTSNIIENKFIKCECWASDSGIITLEDYIIGFNGCKEEKNTFKECSSQQCKYSINVTDYDVGEIKI